MPIVAYRRSPIGVVVPAHNEELSIVACLTALLQQAQPDDNIVVVCNGCTDATAELARGFGDAVQVAEIQEASKIAALNLGDELLGGSTPRLYLDGDVQLGPGAVDGLVAALTGGAELAAPALLLDTSHASLPVRLYSRVWTQLPSVKDDTVGRGAYALSTEGRGRFASFPGVQADDHFVRDCVPADRRVVVRDAVSTVQSSGNLRGLMRRKARTVNGNGHLDSQTPRGRQRARQRRRQWLAVVAHDPVLLPIAPLYLAVSLWPRVVVSLRRMVGTGNTWDRDDTTRRS